MRRSRNHGSDSGFARSRTLSVVAVLLSTLAACSGSDAGSDGPTEAPPADGTVAGCRGSYEGTFAGDASGTMTGSLDSGGTFTINATTAGSGDTATGSDLVQANTEFAFAVGAYAIRGTFDLSNCTVTGTWAEGFDRGTWSMARVGG